MLCLQGSWGFSELLQVPWGLLLLEWQPWFSQIPAGGWTILRPTSGSCGSSEPIQAPQFHECYGWHSSLPHYRTSPLSCSWIHSSPWLAVPHRSPLLVGHFRTFINWAVFSGRWRSPWFQWLWIAVCSLFGDCSGLLCYSHSITLRETGVEPSSSQFSHLTRNKVSWLLSCAKNNWVMMTILSITAGLLRIDRCDMAFIEPMHRNKPNITYSYGSLLLRWHPGF